MTNKEPKGVRQTTTTRSITWRPNKPSATGRTHKGAQQNTATWLLTRCHKGKWAGLGGVWNSLRCRLVRRSSSATRPGVIKDDANLARALKSPRGRHIKALKNLLRYLISARNFEIFFSHKSQIHNISEPLTASADSYYAVDVPTRRSTTRTAIRYMGSHVHYLSNLQSTVAQSSSEAEYTAMSRSSRDVKWIRQLCTE